MACLPCGGISWSMDMSFINACGMKIVMEEDIVVNVMVMTRLDIKNMIGKSCIHM
jgi:hypothetical protein